MQHRAEERNTNEKELRKIKSGKKKKKLIEKKEKITF